MPQHFTILTPNEVDCFRWEQCLQTNIQQASIYMHPAYLNTLTDNWLAVVNPDYSIIGAFPCRKKYEIQYAYTAPFIQSTGIIGTSNAYEKKLIINTIQKKLRYGTMALREITDLGIGIEKNNYLLPLNTEYETLYSCFTKSLQQKITKASKNELQYIHINDVQIAVDMYVATNAKKIPHVKDRAYIQLANFCKQNPLSHCIRAVTDNKGNIYAIALLLQKYDRLYNILNTVTDVGKQANANHYLFSKILEEFCGNNLIFDFEGSTIPGIKSFYQGFNPIEETYTIARFNLLPFPLSLLP